MSTSDPDYELLQALNAMSARGQLRASSRELAETTSQSLATVKRALGRLQAQGRVIRFGNAHATRYTLAAMRAACDRFGEGGTHAGPPAGRHLCAQSAGAVADREAPDPLRLRYRQALSDAIGLIVREGKTASTAIEALRLGEDAAPGFQGLLDNELAALEVFNCARYKLSMGQTEAWIAAGRPR